MSRIKIRSLMQFPSPLGYQRYLNDEVRFHPLRESLEGGKSPHNQMTDVSAYCWRSLIISLFSLSSGDQLLDKHFGTSQPGSRSHQILFLFLLHGTLRVGGLRLWNQTDLALVEEDRTTGSST